MSNFVSLCNLTEKISLLKKQSLFKIWCMWCGSLWYEDADGIWARFLVDLDTKSRACFTTYDFNKQNQFGNALNSEKWAKLIFFCEFINSIGDYQSIRKLNWFKRIRMWSYWGGRRINKKNRLNMRFAKKLTTESY